MASKFKQKVRFIFIILHHLIDHRIDFHSLRFRFLDLYDFRKKSKNLCVYSLANFHQCFLPLPLDPEDNSSYIFV